MAIRPSHLALLVLLATSGCVGVLIPRRGSPDVGGMGDGRSLPKTIDISSKPVYGKREPITLIARDNTECTVSESKFRETAVGENVRCDWRAP